MENWTFEDYYLIFLSICAANKFYGDWRAYKRIINENRGCNKA